MSEVISLNGEREKRSPHLSGHARCLDCEHAWVAVAPVGTMELECPRCKSMKGLWTYTFGPDYDHCMVFTCVTCGSTHLTAYRRKTGEGETRILCVGCGSVQSLNSLFD